MHVSGSGISCFGDLTQRSGSRLLHFTKESLSSFHLLCILEFLVNRIFCYQGPFCAWYFKRAVMFLKMGWKRAGRVIGSFVQALPVWVAEAGGFQGYTLCSFAWLCWLVTWNDHPAVMYMKTLTLFPASSGCISLPAPVMTELLPLRDILKFILCLWKPKPERLTVLAVDESHLR